MEGAYTFDLARILLGWLPWLYLVEILLRTTIVYFFALFVVRTIGKRGMGQLAPFDFVIIIALGSAVGDPMFYPDVPLLHALVAITAIVLLTQGVTRVTQRSNFQLPIDLCSNPSAEFDIHQARESSPHDGVSWRRIMATGEIAAHAGDLG
jgi:hypothetical protein